MSDAQAVLHPKAAGESVEANVVQRVEQLAYVSDREAEWCDALADSLLAPTTTDSVIFCGINLLAKGTHVEIKSAQDRLASGQRGRIYVRKRQHERLLEENAAYLVAVYDPRPGRNQRVLAMAIIPASVLDEILPDGWTSVEGDRSERGYRQLSWSRIIDPDDVEGGDQR
ncbi:hypothetical protein [Halorussus aquaticus]|uniref:Uncharacterized protein n=1 Tax=Halorussus aquaticus TaxID=2953748 RepID=A0ABD5PYI1_9EURY|nr:hypothetical protein [Halorussus aquaticus]